MQGDDRRQNSILYDMCMGREIRQDTHVIVEMIFSLGGYHSSPRDAHAHKIDHIFAHAAAAWHVCTAAPPPHRYYIERNAEAIMYAK